MLASALLSLYLAQLSYRSYTQYTHEQKARPLAHNMLPSHLTDGADSAPSERALRQFLSLACATFEVAAAALHSLLLMKQCVHNG